MNMCMQINPIGKNYSVHLGHDAEKPENLTTFAPALPVVLRAGNRRGQSAGCIDIFLIS